MASVTIWLVSTSRGGMRRPVAHALRTNADDGDNDTDYDNLTMVVSPSGAPALPVVGGNALLAAAIGTGDLLADSGLLGNATNGGELFLDGDLLGSASPAGKANGGNLFSDGDLHGSNLSAENSSGGGMLLCIERNISWRMCCRKSSKKCA